VTNAVLRKSRSNAGVPPEALHALDADGVTVLNGVLTTADVVDLRAAAESLLEAARRDPTRKHGGTQHLDNLQDAGPPFDRVLASPPLLTAVNHVLGADWSLNAYGFRGPRPGSGAQALHTDDVALSPGDPFRVVTAIVALVDFTARNGATRVIPGSHREPPPRYLSPQPGVPHPRERIVTAAAGAAIVFNGHIYHSGTPNASDHRRDALQIVFRRRAEGTR